MLRVIGQNVRAARLQAGLTQECLAELVGLHWQTVSNIERGKSPFSVTTFSLLAQHLEVDPAKLLAGLPRPNARRSARIKKALTRRREPPA
jgi:transcriptional regulator with XRE-family HTH domain